MRTPSTVAEIRRACESSSPSPKPRVTSASGVRERIATPL
jgi:hypothetical protein